MCIAGLIKWLNVLILFVSQASHCGRKEVQLKNGGRQGRTWGGGAMFELGVSV